MTTLQEASRKILGQPTRIAATAAIAAIPPIIVLHVQESVPNPIWTLSDYIGGVPDGIALFCLTAAAIAIGSIALARRVDTRLIRILFIVWAIAVLVAAILPTNVYNTPSNTSASIHSIAGGVLFIVLPIAGYLLSRNLGSTTLKIIAVITGILSLVLVLNRIPASFGMDLLVNPGVLQRVAGLFQIVLLIVVPLQSASERKRHDNSIAPHVPSRSCD